MDEFWGRSPSEWTAIGTLALATATFVLILVTGFLAVMAWRSARSAATSAKAAQEAAEATSRAARVAEAALDRTFKVTYLGIPGREGPAGDGSLHLHGAGSVLYVHGLILKGGYFTELGNEEPTTFSKSERRRAVPFRESPPSAISQGVPQRFHPGEVIPFEWPFQVVDPEKEFTLYCAVQYSIEPDGEVLEVEVEAKDESPGRHVF